MFPYRPLARIALARLLILGLSMLIVALLIGCTQTAPPSPTAPAAPTAAAAPAPTAAATAPTAAAPAATVAAAAPTPTTAAATQPKMGGTLIKSMPSDSTGGNFDAHLATALSVGIWWAPIYESLIGHNMDNFDFAPQLAEKWAVAPDGLSITLSLRKGVKWHNVAPVNGREFTSDDVKWNLERMRDLNPPGLWSGVLKVISAIETPDKYTAKLVLREPAASLIYALAHPTLMMYPKELFDTYGPKQKTVAIGTGPFMFKSYEPEIALRFVKNPDYWDKALPRLDAVNILVIKDAAAQLAALRTGQIHYLDRVSAVDTEALKRANAELKVTPHLADGHGIWLNAKKPPFNDPRVRSALNLAIDRQELVKLALGGSGDIMSAFRPDTLPAGVYRKPDEIAKLPGYRQPKDQDIADATKLLADAGLAGGVKVEALVCSCAPEHVRANEVIREQVKKIGIDWTIKPTEFAPLFQAYTQSGEMQAATGWVVGGDADQVVFQFFHSTGSQNVLGWGSPETDKILEAGRRESDLAKRGQIYRQFEDAQAQSPFRMPLFFTQGNMVARPEFKELRPMGNTNNSFFQAVYPYVWIDK